MRGNGQRFPIDEGLNFLIAKLQFQFVPLFGVEILDAPFGQRPAIEHQRPLASFGHHQTMPPKITPLHPAPQFDMASRNEGIDAAE